MGIEAQGYKGEGGQGGRPLRISPPCISKYSVLPTTILDCLFEIFIVILNHAII